MDVKVRPSEFLLLCGLFHISLTPCQDPVLPYRVSDHRLGDGVSPDGLGAILDNLSVQSVDLMRLVHLFLARLDILAI